MSAHVRGGAPAARKKAHQILAEIGFLRSTHRQCRDKCDKLADAWEMEKAKTDKASIVLRDAQESLALAQEPIDADYLPEGAQPPARIQKRDKQALIVGQLEAALEAQKRGTTRAFDVLNVAERRMFEADRDLHQYVDNMEDAESKIKVQRELDEELTMKLAKKEHNRSTRWHDEQVSSVNKRAGHIHDLVNKASGQIDSAKLAHKTALKRVNVNKDKRTKLIEEIDEVEKAHQEKRLEAVLQTKADTDHARLKAARDSDKHVKKIQKAKQQLEDEKEILLAKGKNPYTEFRRREFKDDAVKEERRMRESVRMNKATLGESMIKEEGGRFKEEAIEAKHKAYEKKHRDEQGRHVIEERNAQYITSVMSSGHEVLDPTGRAPRIDPSQVTDIKDHTFGLGKTERIPAESMRRITEKIRQELQHDKDDVGEYQRLINGLLTAEERKAQAAKEKAARSRPTTSTSTTTDVDTAATTAADKEEAIKNKAAAELDMLATQGGALPGVGAAAVTVNLDGDSEAKAEIEKIASEEGGGAAIEDLDMASVHKYTLGTQTKFELDGFEKAKQDQKDRLVSGTKQVAGGWEFRGQAFISKPAELLFKDFEVGQTYTKIFTMTNVSYTFNSFKILDLEDEYVDFFNITFEKPGRMSAGVSCSMEIRFKPELNEDIFTSVNFYTETGPVAVPLRCLIKRCAPRIVNPDMTFGSMVIGQEDYQAVKINNSEALGTTFKYLLVDDKGVERPITPAARDGTMTSPRSPRPEADADAEAEATDEAGDAAFLSGDAAQNRIELSTRVKRTCTAVLRRKQKENPYPVALLALNGKIDGYSHTSSQIKAAPLELGPVTQRVIVEFDGVKDADMTRNDQGGLVTRRQEFLVQVTGEELPIFLADDEVDMRCTLFGRTYRKRFELRNRAAVTYKVSINIKPPFDQFIEVNPAMCFIQGHGSQFINTKFTPKAGILQDLSYYCVNNEAFSGSAYCELPIEINVTNQELPVFFVLKSEVTPSTIDISQKALDFGKVYINQESTIAITLTNTSMLPQKVAFVKLKKELSVSPNDGFAVLLPNEAMEFEVSFCPLLAQTYDLDLVLMTSVNDRYVIKVKGEAMETPVTFSSSVVVMRTTGPGERVLESTMVTNTTSRQQYLEICAPDVRFSWLRVSPTILNLDPGKSARVELEYVPPKDLIGQDPKEWHSSALEAVQSKTGQSPEGGESEAAGENKTEGEDSAPATGALGMSPFEEWKEGDGWVYASGMYGTIQWVKEGAGTVPAETKPEPEPEAETEQGDGEEKGEETPSPDGEAAAAAEGEEVVADEGEAPAPAPEAVEPFTPKDLPSNEWGVSGSWRLPICIKPKSKPGAAPAPNESPLFLGVQTMVMRPQLEADPKLLDFGQLAMGTRELRTFKVINRSNEEVRLCCDGINAVGPFQVIRPPKLLHPGEVRTLVVECLPVRPGLNTEFLELASAEEVGGHRLRIQLKAQGLKPVISLEGLEAPPPTWNSRCGLVAFGECVASDVVVKKFSIANSSSFAVDVNIARLLGKGLSPSQAGELIERTANGLPVISFRPEKVNIAQGATQEIEVYFRPDRGRLDPFREDLEVVVGQTDEVLKVGIVGRSWTQQVYVATSNPQDEPFHKAMEPGGSGVPAVEDMVGMHPDPAVRKVSIEVKGKIGIAPMKDAPVKLEYPDPFATDANPATYTEADSGAAPAKGKGAAPAAPAGARSQVRRILVGCSEVKDGRAGAGNGTFEIAPSLEFTECGLFSLSVDKGAVNAGASVPVDITCALPKPRGVGGLSVGSWKEYKVEVVIKGGWRPQGAPEETRVPVVLACFVSL